MVAQNGHSNNLDKQNSTANNDGLEKSQVNENDAAEESLS